MSGFFNAIGGVLIASASGVLVALIGQYFAYQREEFRFGQMTANGRRLVVLELRANLEAFKSFWNEINDLDTDHNTADPAKHLEGMAYGGLLARPAPRWSFARWETAESDTLTALSSQEVERLEQVNIDLRQFNDLYTLMITLTPQEQTQISSGGSTQRFWGGYFANWRLRQFTQLTQLANRVLSAKGLPSDDQTRAK